MSSEPTRSFANAYAPADARGVGKPPDLTTLPGRILARREALKLGQAELARRVGVVNTTALRWEKGLSPPRGKNLERLAEVLRVSVDWLRTGEGEMDPANAPVERPASFDEFMRTWPRAGEITPKLERELITFAARTGMRTGRDWSRWIKLAEAVLDSQHSPTFQEKKRNRSK